MTLRDIVSLVEHWQRVMPDREAVRYGDRSWTWAEMADRIRRNAAGQLAAGLRPGDRVAYLDKNHPACLETTLACAGAACSVRTAAVASASAMSRSQKLSASCVLE